MIISRKKLLPIFLIIVLGLSSIIFGGCTVTEKRTGAGAGIGAGVGAAAGAIVGAFLGDAGLGAAIGAGAGAIGGGLIGAMTDSQGNELTKEEEIDVRLKLKEAEGKYDPATTGYKIIRDHKGDIDVIFLPKPTPVEKFQPIN